MLNNKNIHMVYQNIKVDNDFQVKIVIYIKPFLTTNNLFK